MNTRPGQVSAAVAAFSHGGDTRRMKRELAAGNPYVAAKLARLGLEWRDGAIQRSR